MIGRILQGAVSVVLYVILSNSQCLFGVKHLDVIREGSIQYLPVWMVAVLLLINEKAYWLDPYHDPVHIPPRSWHMFVGLEDSRIVEFSTEDKEQDVERITKSKAGSH